MTRQANDAGIRRARRLVVLCIATIFATFFEASAASRLCRQLEAQLADTGRGGGGSPAQARRYDRAIEAQRDQIKKAQRLLRRSNCGSFDFDRGNAACSANNSQLSRMQRNLEALVRKRADLNAGGGNPRRERARLLAALDANGCRGVPEIEEPRERVARRDNRGLFDRLFGAPRRYDDDDPPIRERERVQTTIPAYLEGYSGNHRTLCVRTCDGYYWPISYSSSRADFERDEQNCQTMCPGAEVRLFTHRVPDEESEQMVDLSGKPYADMSTAFKYREVGFVRPTDCACRAAPKNYSVIAGNGAPLNETPSLVALPQARPDPAADPETEANRNGGLDQLVVKQLIASSPSSIASDRKVRVVGPAYLPDPPKAEAPPAPGQTAIR